MQAQNKDIEEITANQYFARIKVIVTEVQQYGLSQKVVRALSLNVVRGQMHTFEETVLNLYTTKLHVLDSLILPLIRVLTQ